jgi:hypothetical protein
MKFFTKQDLDYYSSVIGPKYDKNSSEWSVIKNRLINNGVFDKTEYWAKLLLDLGYEYEFRYNWQISGRIRHYSWAKVYLKGHADSKILFTIGVGSRVANDFSSHDLHFKLDCRRDKLSKYQVELFDDYIKTNDINYLEIVRNEDLVDYSWEQLINETELHFKSLELHYLKLIDVIWPDGIGNNPKIARICWNDLGWEKPSGSNGKSTNADAFESKGYGHEEWLFDLDRVINGYHYGFLQAFNKGSRHGEKFDLHLYTLKYDKGKAVPYWVGRIRETIVLTKKEQEKIFQKYIDNGWYSEMMQELNDVDVESRDLEIVSEEELFNIKFKVDQSTFVIFDELDPISDPKRQIGPGYGRYGLKDLFTKTTSLENSNNNYEFRAGHKKTKTGKTKSVYTKKTIDRTLKHKEIQEHMYNQLANIYGKKRVGTEVPTGYGTSIDVVVKHPDESQWFFEVKTYNLPLICVREALGQILEYAMFSQNNHADKLIVVGVNEPSNSEKEYLKHLRNITGLSIYYQVFDLKKKSLLQLLY